ncbi:MAG: tyrosine--tRNA ligase [Bdellovibrionaceae bacterium]|jgi:tyrosyl-tRNA synthetase|nr:tyrosine--tRNA ligase [Pseudobdellovibrionaceae bacterium]
MFSLTPEEQLSELKKGVVDLVSEKELLAKLKKSYDTKTPLKIKAGFDPTRPDLHIGHVVLINKLRQFQQMGHHIQFLIGDFTALIGDPTGKNEARPPLTEEEIAENSKTYAEQVFKVLDREKTEVMYNSHWFNDFKPADFIRLSAKYTVARMIERDDFEKRYQNGTPIHLHEFLYPLVQGYDSVAMKADVELGGTDQKFNLLVGRDIQKSSGMAQQSILTVPLLEGIDGIQKMSKSNDNYIAIQDSPKNIFGKTMKISDELMIRYYELLTDKTVSEIEVLKMGIKGGELHPRDVKVDLAKYFVSLFYDDTMAESALKEFENIFKNKGLPDDLAQHEVKSSVDLEILSLLIEVGFSKSKGEGRRGIQGGAVTIDGEKISDPMFQLKLKGAEKVILKMGKKKFVQLVAK